MRSCPFCGERKYIEWQTVIMNDGQDKPNYLIQCLACGAKGPEGVSRVDAQDKWDKRKK